MDELRPLDCKFAMAKKAKDVPESWLCDKSLAKTGLIESYRRMAYFCKIA